MQLGVIGISWVFNRSVDISTFSYPKISDDTTSISAKEHASESTYKSENVEPKCILTDSMDEDEIGHVNLQNAEKRILAELPESYVNKMLRVEKYEDINSCICSFKLEFGYEEKVKKWVSAYNEISKVTMVYESCRSGKGKTVIKKFYLRCHHKKRQSSGKHAKRDRKLKNT